MSLYYKDARSDKVYHVQIEKDRDGFVVNFQYGRRGSTLQTGTKTNTPVNLDKAQVIYLKLVSEKMGKGYTTGAEGTPFQGTPEAGLDFGYVPQLLNFIDESTAVKLFDDRDWMMQEKKDGVRMMIKRQGNVITAGNRKGRVIGVSSAIAEAVLALTVRNEADFVLDGEAIGDVYWPFDILRFNGIDLTSKRAEQRFTSLGYLLDTAPSPALGRVPTAYGSAHKEALFEIIRKAHGEGVVFKKVTSKYVAGRPNSGGNQLKHKFKDTATVWVVAQNTNKRSIMIAAQSDSAFTPGPRVGVGSVTIPANYEIPADNSLIDVEYLYAYPGGSLFQPVYKGTRDDKTEADLYSTLKFKQGTMEDEDA